MSTPFTKRLGRVHVASGLSIKEMAIWFEDMSPPVMRTWLLGRQPQAYRRALAEKNLGFLEREIKEKKARLPLSGSLRQGERHQHVAAIRKSYR